MAPVGSRASSLRLEKVSPWSVNHRRSGLEDHAGVRVEVGTAVNAMGVSFWKRAHPERRCCHYGLPVISKDDLRGSDSLLAAPLPAKGTAGVSVECPLHFDLGGKDVLFTLEELAYKLRVHELEGWHAQTLATEP